MSAQGQTLLAGDQLDSWLGLVCPGTRIDKPISERNPTLTVAMREHDK